MILNYFYLCVRIYANTYRGQNMVVDNLGVELQAIVSHLAKVLSTQVLWQSNKPYYLKDLVYNLIKGDFLS